MLPVPSCLVEVLRRAWRGVRERVVLEDIAREIGYGKGRRWFEGWFEQMTADSAGWTRAMSASRLKPQ